MVLLAALERARHFLAAEDSNDTATARDDGATNAPLEVAAAGANLADDIVAKAAATIVAPDLDAATYAEAPTSNHWPSAVVKPATAWLAVRDANLDKPMTTPGQPTAPRRAFFEFFPFAGHLIRQAKGSTVDGTAPSLMVCSCPSEGADAAADGENAIIWASLGNLATEHHVVVKFNHARHLAVDDIATTGRGALLHAPNQFVAAVVESSQVQPTACAANSQALLHAQVLLHAPAQPLGAEAEGVAACTETPRLSRHPVLVVKTTQARPAPTGETPSFPAASSCLAADADDAGDAMIMDAFLQNLKAEDSAADEDPTADEDLGVAYPADASADATILAALDTTFADNSAEPKSNTISRDNDDATAHLDAVEGNATPPQSALTCQVNPFGRLSLVQHSHRLLLIWPFMLHLRSLPCRCHNIVNLRRWLQFPKPGPLKPSLAPADEDCALVHSTQNRPFASFAAIKVLEPSHFTYIAGCISPQPQLPAILLKVNSFSCGNAATLFAHGAATSFDAGLHANTADRMVHANHPLRAPAVGTNNQANHWSALGAAKSARASVTDATVSPQLPAHATLAPIAMSSVPFNRYIGANLLTQTPNFLLCQGAISTSNNDQAFKVPGKSLLPWISINFDLGGEPFHGCLLGKASHQSFPRSQTRSSQLNQLVHSDVCGPMENLSLTDYCSLALRQHDLAVQTLRSDNGGEYISKAFQQFCRDEGIQQQFTIPYTPQQNGVSERKNRTLVQAARAMILTAGLSKSY
ncbi:hypothetical protein L7F22_013553 [Adiantum nelumboides]|nr:hypothetical protein [Adiantum nelumboides]